MPPFLKTSATTILPGLVLPTALGKSDEDSINLPSNLVMTSPGRRPPFSAGAPFSMPATNAPLVFFMPNDSESSFVTS